MSNLWAQLLRRGLRNGFDRGVVGGSPLWLVLGGLALLGWLAERSLPRHPESVFSGQLEPGEGMEITLPTR